jgi:hypothetical protein
MAAVQTSIALTVTMANADPASSIPHQVDVAREERLWASGRERLVL